MQILNVIYHFYSASVPQNRVVHLPDVSGMRTNASDKISQYGEVIQLIFHPLFGLGLTHPINIL